MPRGWAILAAPRAPRGTSAHVVVPRRALARRGVPQCARGCLGAASVPGAVAGRGGCIKNGGPPLLPLLLLLLLSNILISGEQRSSSGDNCCFRGERSIQGKQKHMLCEACRFLAKPKRFWVNEVDFRCKIMISCEKGRIRAKNNDFGRRVDFGRKT